MKIPGFRIYRIQIVLVILTCLGCYVITTPAFGQQGENSELLNCLNAIVLPARFDSAYFSHRITKGRNCFFVIENAAWILDIASSTR
jgi:hypothetical protein